MDRNYFERDPQAAALLKTGDKKVLVLDLDETLVHCKLWKFKTSTKTAVVCYDHKISDVHISIRPGLEVFIQKMSELYTLVLFTSGVKQYAEGILKELDLRKYFFAVLHRDYCQLNEKFQFEKDLSILGVAPEKIILIDDSITHIRNQPQNILIIKPFTGDQSDRELSKISRYLESIASNKDVRPVMENFFNFELYSATETDYQETGMVQSTKASVITENEFNFKQIDEENQENRKGRPVASIPRPRTFSVGFPAAKTQEKKELPPPFPFPRPQDGNCRKLVETLPRMMPKSQYARLKGVAAVI